MSGQDEASSDCGGCVQTSLLLTAVYQCRLCQFHAIFYDDMTKHLRSAHPSCDMDGREPTSTTNSTSILQSGSCSMFDKNKPSPSDYFEAQKEDSTEAILTILKEVQTLGRMKCLLTNDIDFRVFFETENGILGDKADEENSKLANAFKIVLQMLMAKSQFLLQNKSFDLLDSDKSGTDTGMVAQKRFQQKSVHQSTELVTSPSTCSPEKKIGSEGLKVQTAPVAGSLDNTHYATLLEAERSSNERAVLSPDKQSCDQSLDSDRSLESQEAKHSHRMSVNDASSKDHDYEKTRLEIKQELNESHKVQMKSQQLQTPKLASPPHSGTVQSKDLSGSTSSREEEKPEAASSKLRSSQETASKGARTSTPLPLLTLESSKLYGNVDFQDIAQRASRSNPEATTITVVQHTGGNRPPTTIHFKKSHKSNAIIPTGESLGIKSPFLRKEYAGSKIFACKECHSRYKTQNELERHTTKKHRKKKSFLCEVCGDGLSTRSGMKIHIARKHGGASVLKCDVCDYVTRSEVRLNIHQKKHNKEKSEFFCKPCNKSFVTESKLLQHQNSPVHKNAIDPIICEHCGYVTKKRDNFLVHLRKHTGEKPYKCRHCDYAAADGSTLKRHVMARHSAIRPFRCPNCQFSCVDKKGLTLHMRKHTGERPYTCNLCPYSAKRMGALTVHRRTHLRNQSPTAAGGGASEVASYVDISDIPITPATPGASKLQTQDGVESAEVSMATDGNLVLSAQTSRVSVQLPADTIVAQETDHSVRALWQSMS